MQALFINTSMEVSSQGLANLLHLEGLFIWYNGLPVRKALSSEEAVKSLSQNIVAIENKLNTITKIKLSQNQFDALAIASFDQFIGIEAIKKSKILRLIKAGQTDRIEERLLGLNKFSDLIIPEIFRNKQLRRRRVEADIFIRSNYQQLIVPAQKTNALATAKENILINA